MADLIERLEKKVGKIEPEGCRYCDFSSGRRGMDRCSKCDGIGSVFRVGARTFFNTKDGYIAALKARSTSKEPG